MRCFRKIFASILLFLIFFNLNAFAEVVKKIEVTGNDRVSKETIVVFGDIIIGKDYEKKDDEFEKIPDIDEKRSNYDIISWSLSPSDLIAFNFATIHGAPGNNSTNRRRAFSARFTGDDATFAIRKGETSPPFPEVNLKHGEKMDSITFPIIPI